jgi:long-subunit acyl-CoA synthetase (AMP-forming)
MITSNPFDDDRIIAGTVGHALPGTEVEITDTGT